MLLIQSRKRTDAISELSFVDRHQILKPQSPEDKRQDKVQDGISDEITTHEPFNLVSRHRIATLSLEQLVELSELVSERIHIKKRYNNTPLRRIIAHQVSTETTQSDCDRFSQTDTLLNTEPSEVTPKSIEDTPEDIQARFNSTPLRRILSRQVPAESRKTEHQSRPTPSAKYEPEPVEVRRARYNNTPLRRIISRQTYPEALRNKEGLDNAESPDALQITTLQRVPRSNTPLRRILSRQQSSPTEYEEDYDAVSTRADSVIDLDSPIRSESSANKPPPPTTVILNSEARIREYEEALWKTASYPLTDKEARATVVTVTEVVLESKEPRRIVVDSKGSPLRRILQRQTSRDWRAPARVAVA
ncbi:hypothetical protein N0V94_007382 [Neodidymelliopsis sp. IMI 364377]|nr:hypothetical protein N0V94_007382 [Neodidymelliopsis sp. IMI 364377]